MKKENKSLSEKIFDSKLVLGDDISKIFAKDVKEKIQNVQIRLKGWLLSKVEKNPKGKVTIAELSEEIDKIFKEEFGEKLI